MTKKRQRHGAEQVVKKLRDAETMLACPHPTVPPIQDVLVDVFSLLKDRGVTVVSANESSLLVQNGLCQAISF